jgi:hypothetical protein
MTNDAKLGLVVGVALVITVALVFFRKDAIAVHAAPSNIPVSTSAADKSPLRVKNAEAAPMNQSGKNGPPRL